MGVMRRAGDGAGPLGVTANTSTNQTRATNHVESSFPQHKGYKIPAERAPNLLVSRRARPLK
jgi:hypothetical protein